MGLEFARRRAGWSKLGEECLPKLVNCRIKTRSTVKVKIDRGRNAGSESSGWEVPGGGGLRVVGGNIALEQVRKDRK